MEKGVVFDVEKSWVVGPMQNTSLIDSLTIGL